MAYFHCLIGGGSSGGGYELTVTCDADFAGTTITATDGVTTLTQTCPSASPYEVVFAIPNGGTWTVSGIVSGSTCTASIDIPDELELIAIPDGSTVTPTDVIQTWLKCGGIFDKSYTTLNEVLADSTTLLALMSDDNAADYLVRSTTWASGVTANSTAMTDIGANNYCADTLLSDSTWAEAICNSTYFESVLNTKVPTMTSNTTPSGTCFASGSSDPAYYAFDGNDSTHWAAPDAVDGTVGYEFTSDVCIRKAKFRALYGTRQFSVSYSDDGTTYTSCSETVTATNAETDYYVLTTATTAHKYWRMNVHHTQGASGFFVQTVQFYGRVDV